MNNPFAKRYGPYKSKHPDRCLLLRIGAHLRQFFSKFKAWVLIAAGLCIAAAVVILLVFLGSSAPEPVRTAAPAASPTPVTQLSDKPAASTPAAAPGPTPLPAAAMQARFVPLFAQNPDLVGWITVEDTAVDYPVVQGSDDAYYMTHDFYGEETKYGAIFASAGSETADIANARNIVLYGHHMNDGAMFAGLDAYRDETFFRDHPVIRFDTLYEDFEWRVFAVYVSPITFPYNDTTFLSDASWIKFLGACQEKSMFETDIVLSETDVVLTLSTCAYEFDNARFVVQAVLVRDAE